jgi:hypothetical protein
MMGAQKFLCKFPVVKFPMTSFGDETWRRRDMISDCEFSWCTSSKDRIKIQINTLLCHSPNERGRLGNRTGQEIATGEFKKQQWRVSWSTRILKMLLFFSDFAQFIGSDVHSLKIQIYYCKASAGIRVKIYQLFFLQYFTCRNMFQVRSLIWASFPPLDNTELTNNCLFSAHEANMISFNKQTGMVTLITAAALPNLRTFRLDPLPATRLPRGGWGGSYLIMNWSSLLCFQWSRVNNIPLCASVKCIFHTAAPDSACFDRTLA